MSIDKAHIRKKLDKFVSAMKYYHKTMGGKMYDIEAHCYYEDHFSYEERQYLKRHCPLIIRFRLFMLGVHVL